MGSNPRMKLITSDHGGVAGSNPALFTKITECISINLMRRTRNRTIKVDKNKLIEKIKENKKAHIEAYEKALVAYKTEAFKQLSSLKTRAEEGDTKLYLQLTTPINNAENYDKIVEMFEWEVEDFVELEQQEFNEYVQDETDFARMAKLSNSAYIR